MRSHRTRQSDAYLERVLDGRSARQDALTKLMSAARTPDAADTAGLPTALAAFRAAAGSYPATSRKPTLIKRVLAAKLLTAAGIALTATGGIAAAASGHLPSPLPHSSHAADTAKLAVATSHGRPTSTPSESESVPSSTSASAEPSASHPAANPSPSVRGLCQAWLARPHQHGSADTNPAFSFLVSTAGGTAAVDGYCTALLAGSPSSSAGAPSPTTSVSHPGGKPSTVPSASHPDGKPSAVPSHSHPGGKPSPMPTAPPTRR